MSRPAVAATIIVLAATAAGAQTATQEKLAKIDRAFVCPESLPNDQARHDAVTRFLEDAAAADPALTIQKMVELRVAMLKAHDCRETLANIARQQHP